jgi:hypothetical protein
MALWDSLLQVTAAEYNLHQRYSSTYAGLQYSFDSTDPVVMERLERAAVLQLAGMLRVANIVRKQTAMLEEYDPQPSTTGSMHQHWSQQSCSTEQAPNDDDACSSNTSPVPVFCKDAANAHVGCCTACHCQFPSPSHHSCSTSTSSAATAECDALSEVSSSWSSSEDEAMSEYCHQ